MCAFHHHRRSTRQTDGTTNCKYRDTLALVEVDWPTDLFQWKQLFFIFLLRQYFPSTHGLSPSSSSAPSSFFLFFSFKNQNKRQKEKLVFEILFFFSPRTHSVASEAGKMNADDRQLSTRTRGVWRFLFSLSVTKTEQIGFTFHFS